MSLDDGRFLVSPSRYSTLLQSHSQQELDALRLVRVHPDFQVGSREEAEEGGKGEGKEKVDEELGRGERKE
jgi:hypothetical protein